MNNQNYRIKLKNFHCLFKGVSPHQEINVFDEDEAMLCGFNVENALMNWLKVKYENYIQYSVYAPSGEKFEYGHNFNEFASSNDVFIKIKKIEIDKGVLKVSFNGRDDFYFELSVFESSDLEFDDKTTRNINLGISLKTDLINFGIQEVLDIENGVTDIAVNKPNEFWYKQNDKWTKVDNDNITFESLMNFAKKFAEFNNSIVDAENPLCNGKMPNGFNCQVIIPPAVYNDVVAIVIVVN